MKTLVKNESAKYFSETIAFNDNKFKIVSINDYLKCHLKIYVYTKNGDVSEIANENDIPNFKYIDWNKVQKDELRLKECKDNIKAAEEYIKKIF